MTNGLSDETPARIRHGSPGIAGPVRQGSPGCAGRVVLLINRPFSPCSTLNVENTCGVIAGGLGANLDKSKLSVIGPATVAVVEMSKTQLLNPLNPGPRIRQWSPRSPTRWHA